MTTTSDGPRKLNTLVLDDEHLVADSLVQILNKYGFNASSAYSGSQAIDHATSAPPDVLIADVVMQGMSGIDAAIEICKVQPNCKVILFSGNEGASQLLRDAHDRGHDFEILAKPVHPSVIIEKLKAMSASV